MKRWKLKLKYKVRRIVQKAKLIFFWYLTPNYMKGVTNREQLIAAMFKHCDPKRTYKKPDGKTWEQFYDGYKNKMSLGCDLTYKVPLYKMAYWVGVEELLRVGGKWEDLTSEWKDMKFDPEHEDAKWFRDWGFIPALYPNCARGAADAEKILTGSNP